MFYIYYFIYYIKSNNELLKFIKIYLNLNLFYSKNMPCKDLAACFFDSLLHLLDGFESPQDGFFNFSFGSY